MITNGFNTSSLVLQCAGFIAQNNMIEKTSVKIKLNDDCQTEVNNFKSVIERLKFIVGKATTQYSPEDITYQLIIKDRSYMWHLIIYYSKGDYAIERWMYNWADYKSSNLVVRWCAHNGDVDLFNDIIRQSNTDLHLPTTPTCLHLTATTESLVINKITVVFNLQEMCNALIKNQFDLFNSMIPFTNENIISIMINLLNMSVCIERKKCAIALDWLYATYVCPELTNNEDSVYRLFNALDRYTFDRFYDIAGVRDHLTPVLLARLIDAEYTSLYLKSDQFEYDLVVEAVTILMFNRQLDNAARVINIMRELV
jgi:hypothetical protein